MTTPGNPHSTLQEALRRYVAVQDSLRGAATEPAAPEVIPLPIYPLPETGGTDGPIHPEH